MRHLELARSRQSDAARIWVWKAGLRLHSTFPPCCDYVQEPEAGKEAEDETKTETKTEATNGKEDAPKEAPKGLPALAPRKKKAAAAEAAKQAEA